MFHANPNTRTMVALFAAMVLLAAACGTSNGNGDEGGIASINDGTTDAGDDSSPSDGQGTTEAPTNVDDAFALYDACMAEAGFEIQTVDIGGGTGNALDLAPTTGGEDDPQAGEADTDFGADGFEEANATCEAHLANADSSFEVTPEQEAAFADADLKWTQCMRDQGIDMPGTEATGGVAVESDGGGEGGGDDPQGSGETGGEDFDFEAFDAAAEACNSIFDEIDDLFEGESDQ